MKRIIAVLLIVATLMGVAGNLVGCSSKNQGPLTMGMWLSMINQAFGMDTYLEETPFFSNVDADNPYFSTVQTAVEWGVIDDSSEELDVEGNVTWGEALVTLVNVGEFLSDSASNEEKIDYAIENFDTTIRKYWKNRNISQEKALTLLAKTQDLWATKTYDTPIQEFDYAEEVKDFTSEEKTLTNYTINDNVVAIPVKENVDIKPGDVFMLPANDVMPGITAYKATDVTSDEQYVYVRTDSDELGIEDVFENLQIQQTTVPLMENAVVTDANGNVVSVGSNINCSTLANYGNVDVGDLKYRGAGDSGIQLLSNNGNAQITPLADLGKVSHEFDLKIKGETWTVGFEYDLNGELDLAFKVETPNLLDVDETSGKSLKGEFEVALEGLSVTQNIDYEWFKLKEATVRVDYETKTSLGIQYKNEKKDKVFAPKISNGNGKFLTNWKNSVWKDFKKENNGAKTIKICSIDLWNGGVVRLCLDIKFKLEIDGSVSIEVTQSGSKGVQYKDKKLRFINTSDWDWDIEVKAGIEGTLGLGPAIYTVGLKKSLIGASISGGFGGKFKLTFHVADTENHLIEEMTAEDMSADATDIFENTDLQADVDAIAAIAKAQGGVYEKETSEPIKLHLDACLNVVVYGIIRVGLETDSLAGELLGNKVSLSKEFVNDKNGTIATLHIDRNGIVLKWGNSDQAEKYCKFEYKPFEEGGADATEPTDATSATDSTEATEEDDAILKGDALILGEMKTSLDIGDEYYVVIQQLPEGYNLSDLTMKSSDPSIAKVNEKGVVIAQTSGSTVLIVQTKDGKYTAMCAITVLLPQPQTSPFVPI